MKWFGILGPMPVQLPLASALPFVALLLAISLGPLVAPAWWGRHRNQAIVAGLVSLPIILYLGVSLGHEGRVLLEERLKEYVSFIVVIGALFVISGGIHIGGSLSGTPLANTGLLAIGAVLANLIGTTGASALLIRPLLRANKTRRRSSHIVVFFIFVVSNCAGLLTPLGDPPLLLGFLKGVPFEWTLVLWPQWLLVNAALLLVFNVWDQVVFGREERARTGSQLEAVLRHEPPRIDGKRNVLFLAAVLATILAAGRAAAAGRPWHFGIQEILIAQIAIGAYVVTAPSYRQRNSFTFGPIIEVAVLFAAIFITMAPVLDVLNSWSQGQRDVLGMSFGLREPWHFFWATGALSSVLDNAPTYLAFSASAAGLQGVAPHGQFLHAFLATGPVAGRTLMAIAAGAVFMGSMTYIGNAPNFMVRAIAEENGVKMPSFFGYVAYSAAVLIPIFVVVSLAFYS
jgi:Na+/H+ antiporter NhaD/arsenite permease-like protein